MILAHSGNNVLTAKNFVHVRVDSILELRMFEDDSELIGELRFYLKIQKLKNKDAKEFIDLKNDLFF